MLSFQTFLLQQQFFEADCFFTFLTEIISFINIPFFEFLYIVSLVQNNNCFYIFLCCSEQSFLVFIFFLCLVCFYSNLSYDFQFDMIFVDLYHPMSVFLFLCRFFLSRTFTIHRTAEEGGSCLFKSSLPFPFASQTLSHQQSDYCRKLTSAHSQQPDSNRELLVSERKSLTTKLRL